MFQIATFSRSAQDKQMTTHLFKFILEITDTKNPPQNERFFVDGSPQMFKRMPRTKPDGPDASQEVPNEEILWFLLTTPNWKLPIVAANKKQPKFPSKGTVHLDFKFLCDGKRIYTIEGDIDFDSEPFPPNAKFRVDKKLAGNQCDQLFMRTINGELASIRLYVPIRCLPDDLVIDKRSGKTASESWGNSSPINNNNTIAQNHNVETNDVNTSNTMNGTSKFELLRKQSKTKSNTLNRQPPTNTVEQPPHPLPLQQSKIDNPLKRNGELLEHSNSKQRKIDSSTTPTRNSKVVDVIDLDSLFSDDVELIKENPPKTIIVPQPQIKQETMENVDRMQVEEPIEEFRFEKTPIQSDNEDDEKQTTKSKSITTNKTTTKLPFLGDLDLFDDESPSNAPTILQPPTPIPTPTSTPAKKLSRRKIEIKQLKEQQQMWEQQSKQKQQTIQIQPPQQQTSTPKEQIKSTPKQQIKPTPTSQKSQPTPKEPIKPTPKEQIKPPPKEQIKPTPTPQPTPKEQVKPIPSEKIKPTPTPTPKEVSKPQPKPKEPEVEVEVEPEEPELAPVVIAQSFRKPSPRTISDKSISTTTSTTTTSNSAKLKAISEAAAQLSKKNPSSNYDSEDSEIPLSQQYEESALKIDTVLDLDESDIVFTKKALGTGSYATVYEGKYDSKKVALKQFPESYEQKKIRNEAILLNAIEHPNVVQLFGVCVATRTIVLELCDKGNLYDALHNSMKGRNAKKAVVACYPHRYDIALGIARGMTAVHDQDIMHSDLSSLNILLDSDFNPKVCDFGISKKGKIHDEDGVVGENGDDDQTSSGVAAIRWRSPEIFQLQKSKKNGSYSKTDYTNKIDVYGFSIILWELLNIPEAPWSNLVMDSDVSKTVLSGQRPPIGRNVNEEWANLVRKCWNQDPIKRPSFLEIVLELKPMVELIKQSKKTS